MASGGLGGLKGEVVVPGDPEYEAARQMVNRRIHRFPRAIAYCEDRRDVARCIEWARQRGAPIRVRVGGHGGEGYATGNGALVIDLSRMTGVTVESGTICAQGGATNRAVYDAVGPLGYVFPGGVCPTAGVSALTLGGGWGQSCRMLGLACDSLMSVELVDAYGRNMSANAHCNQELLWALRGGGGGNFGVVTDMRFRLHDMRPETMTLVTLRWPNADADAQVQFWKTWQQWLDGADTGITMEARIFSTADGCGVTSRGLFYGASDAAEAAVAPLASLPGCEATFEEATFYGAMQAMMAGCPTPGKFKSAGRFVTRPLAQEKICRLVDSLRDTPKSGAATAYTLYAMGGAVGFKSCVETAFFFRDAAYIAEMAATWEQDDDEAAGIAWVDDHYPYLAGMTAGSCVSIPYGGLKDAMRAYYGGNAARLRRVKRLYDPYGVFRFPQSVR